MSCKCTNLQNGDIIYTKETLKGSVCVECGRDVVKLDWDIVPLHRKIIR